MRIIFETGNEKERFLDGLGLYFVLLVENVGVFVRLIFHVIFLHTVIHRANKLKASMTMNF
jgi:hypothetical protein